MRHLRVFSLNSRPPCAIRAQYPNSTRKTRMLDATDSRLLALLQVNAMLTAQDLGEALNLSPSQAARQA